MDVKFERGDPQNPKGHALAYFRDRTDPNKVYAVYIIVLPISVDFAKYVPPFLASHMGSTPFNDLSAFSLPPVPEEVSGYQELQHLAEIREDDLLFAGSVSTADLPEMMETVGEVVRNYSQTWSRYVKPAITAAKSREEESAGAAGVNEVLYSMMNERDRLAELSKLMGKLRFAMEGGDQQTRAETNEDIKILSRFLPESYYIPSLLQAVLDSSVTGTKLAQLYLDRCYKLSNNDSDGASDLENQIEALKSTE